MKIKVQYKETGDCEDRETIKAILELCENSRINNGGAAREAIIRIQEFEDGDQGVIIEFEAPQQNLVWSKSAYKFVGRLWDKFPEAWVCPISSPNSGYRIRITTHTCDPD